MVNVIFFKGPDMLAETLLIKTEIKVGSAILNHVFTLTFMKFKLIGICIMQKVRI